MYPSHQDKQLELRVLLPLLGLLVTAGGFECGIYVPLPSGTCLFTSKAQSQELCADLPLGTRVTSYLQQEFSVKEISHRE